jgi:hypothetical protein
MNNNLKEFREIKKFFFNVIQILAFFLFYELFIFFY